MSGEFWVGRNWDWGWVWFWAMGELDFRTFGGSEPEYRAWGKNRRLVEAHFGVWFAKKVLGYL